MAKVQHHSKKRHTKRHKHRHPVVTKKSNSTSRVSSCFQYKLSKASIFCPKMISLALCFLMLLSLFMPIAYSIMQSIQSKHSDDALILQQVLPFPDYTKAFVSSFQCFQDNAFIENMQESIHDALIEVAHLKRVEMGIPDVVYLHSRRSSFPTVSAFPEVITERLSEEDLEVDLTHAFDFDTTYECSPELKDIFCRILQREAGSQPFLGKLILAEGIVSRVYSGAYGNSSTNSILVKGYSAKMDSDGKLHIYNRRGKDIISYPEDVQEAVELALQGSRVSHTILKAVTEFQNTKYGLQLDDTYSKWGAMYHYSPANFKKEEQFRRRSINQAPVSFQFVDHVFYGLWLNSSQQLNL